MAGAPTTAAVLDPHAGDEILAGTRLVALQPHPDRRGSFTELYRVEWFREMPALQWSLTVNAAGVMRGVHVHLHRQDFFALIDGACEVGLRDLRPGSPTADRAVQFALDTTDPKLLVIPPGVAHGFHFPTPTRYVIGVSSYYDPADELGCHWRDPDLGINWPVADACLSDRDQALPALRDVAARIPPWR